MTHSVANSLGAVTFGCLGQLGELIAALPDRLWVKDTGGWPAWQHIVHSIATADVFIPGQSTPPPDDMTEEILDLREVGLAPPDKSTVMSYLETVQIKLDAFVKSLADTDLLEANEQLAQIGLPFNLAMTLSALGGHTSYHVGYGDALLRSEGLPGVF